MSSAFFVTGTDTGVGKTLVTCALLHATRRLGLTAVGMKPIAAGIEADGRNDDVVQLLAASSVQPPLEWVNPYLYAPPIAPHIAAAEAGRPIDIAVIRQAFERLRTGGGGLGGRRGRVSGTARRAHRHGGFGASLGRCRWCWSWGCGWDASITPC